MTMRDKAELMLYCNYCPSFHWIRSGTSIQNDLQRNMNSMTCGSKCQFDFVKRNHVSFWGYFAPNLKQFDAFKE